MGVLIPHITAGRVGSQEEAENTDHGPLALGNDCPGASRDSDGLGLSSCSVMLQAAPPHSPEAQRECTTLEPGGRDGWLSLGKS